MSWAARELAGAPLPDARLAKRLVRLVDALVGRPMASVPLACGGWAATKAAYRFWASERVTPAAIRAPHREHTLARIREAGTVVLIRDTTELDLTAHPATTGLGYLDHPQRRGLKVPSALAATTDGVPLGVLDQVVWRRDPAELGKKRTRARRPTAEQESQRWLTAFQATQALLPAEVVAITVADREADLYDLFALPRRPADHLLVRAADDRRVDHPARRRWAAARQSPVVGALTADRPRGDDRPARAAALTRRAATLLLQPPGNRPRRAGLAAVPVRAVRATEETPPAGAAAVEWRLLTTLPAATPAEAAQVVGWCRRRWLIERYHFALKSGCRIEELRLETAARLERALATYSLVAWRRLWLTYLARRQPDAPCTVALATPAWQALACASQRTATPPAAPPPLRQAAHWIARLGGFLGRAGDGDPGVTVIWRGLQRLEDIVATWLLLDGGQHHQLDPPLMGKE